MTVLRSGYYEWLYSPKTAREKENEELIEILRLVNSPVLFKKGRSSYGTRRLKNKFAEQGLVVSRRRIGRLMNPAGLWCKTKKKFKATTNSKHNQPLAPNLLKRQFTVTQPDRYYVGDITYITEVYPNI